jgi:hypothetical protein
MKSVIKNSLLMITMISALSACGGDDTSKTSGTTTGTTSAGLTEALTVFAESWTGTQMLANFHDLAVIAGNNGSCGGGGSVSYLTSLTTMSNCIRRFPADNGYLGGLTGIPVQVGTIKSATLQNNGDITVKDGSSIGTTRYTINTINFSATDDTSTTGKEMTQVMNGTLGISLTTGSSFSVGSVSSISTNSGSSLSTTSGFTYTRNHGNANRVVTSSNLVVNADATNMSQRPASGQYTVAVGTAGSTCVNVGVQFVSTTQVKLTCSNTAESRVINWTDTDVKTALALALS